MPENSLSQNPLIIPFTIAAPLIAALDYRPLLNTGRKNWGLNIIFWLEAAFEYGPYHDLSLVDDF